MIKIAMASSVDSNDFVISPEDAFECAEALKKLGVIDRLEYFNSKERNGRRR